MSIHRMVLPVAFVLAIQPAASARDLLPFQEAGRGHVRHDDASPAGTRTVDVETYVPRACAAKPCPLLIAIHGLQRNAESARDAWIEAAERHGLLIAAPQFDRERFPTRAFQQGGVRGQAEPADWTFSVVERFFDRALESGRVAGDRYVLFGHSAGAQFVHRMALFMPQARFSTAIAANAGFYTLPLGREAAGGFPFPYSLDGAPSRDATLKAAFGRPLIVMLGERDTKTDDPDLNASRGAAAQGANRLQRGQRFVAAAGEEARRLGVESRWRLILVPDAGHQARRMAKAAVVALFGK